MVSKANNEGMQLAKAAKKDEFYTRLEDIERELSRYKEHLKGKTIYCNCDDPRVSNFFRYFSLNFDLLGLRGLTTTCFKSTELDLFSTRDEERAISLHYRGTAQHTGVPTEEDTSVTYLDGDGDFRSRESIEILKSTDVVVTNPPFSLFREFVPQLIAHEKKFLVVGHQNAITYKEIFPLIMENKIWLGYGFPGAVAHFNSPYKDTAAAGDHKEGMIRISGVQWFTNLDVSTRHEKLVLFRKYDPDHYPRYDDFDAIEVGRTKDIPVDYAGVMGVPITFMTKFNPDQFEILGNLGSYAPDGYSLASKIHINGKKIFKRIAIRNREL
jgi:hypothetical protein